MKVLIYTDRKNGNVVRVDSRFPQTTDDELQSKINRFNENEENNYVSCQEVEGIMEEVIKFLLGEKQYKRTYEIEEICDDLRAIHKEIRDYQNDLDELNEQYESLKDSLNDAIELTGRISTIEDV